MKNRFDVLMNDCEPKEANQEKKSRKKNSKKNKKERTSQESKNNPPKDPSKNRFEYLTKYSLNNNLDISQSFYVDYIRNNMNFNCKIPRLRRDITFNEEIKEKQLLDGTIVSRTEFHNFFLPPLLAYRHYQESLPANAPRAVILDFQFVCRRGVLQRFMEYPSSQDIKEKKNAYFKAQLVRGKIFIERKRDSTSKDTNIGHEFERYCTNNPVESNESVYRLGIFHMPGIKYGVLMPCEVDATTNDSETDLIEIKLNLLFDPDKLERATRQCFLSCDPEREETFKIVSSEGEYINKEVEDVPTSWQINKMLMDETLDIQDKLQKEIRKVKPFFKRIKDKVKKPNVIYDIKLYRNRKNRKKVILISEPPPPNIDEDDFYVMNEEAMMNALQLSVDAETNDDKKGHSDNETQ